MKNKDKSRFGKVEFLSLIILLVGLAVAYEIGGWGDEPTQEDWIDQVSEMKKNFIDNEKYNSEVNVRIHDKDMALSNVCYSITYLPDESTLNRFVQGYYQERIWGWNDTTGEPIFIFGRRWAKLHGERNMIDVYRGSPNDTLIIELETGVNKTFKLGGWNSVEHFVIENNQTVIPVYDCYFDGAQRASKKTYDELRNLSFVCDDYKRVC